MAPSQATPHQLTDGDSIFLSMETPTSGGHVGAVVLLDPSSSEGFGFEKLRDHIVSRVSLVPRFGWRLQEVPLGLDRPYWVEAEDFDPASHVFRLAVPSPGNVRQVYELASRLHSQPVDRSRPLWEIHYIEGVENGRAALYMKTHHCLVDGTGGSGLAEVLADLTPDATGPLVAPEAFVEDRPAEPTASDVVRRAIRNANERPARFLTHVGRAVSMLWESRNDEEEVPAAPRTSFNQGISRRRAFASASLDFERLRKIGKHYEVKFNDVVLEIAGSAVRRWLRDRGEMPAESLVAMCPVSTRGDEKGLGNQITSMAVPLHTDLADPAARLQKIHEASTKAKDRLGRANFDWTGALGESFAPIVTSLFVKGAELAADSGPLPGNFVVSNVRGAPVPLYFGGARVESMMPMSILAVGNGLNITVVSYCDRLDVGLIVDPDLIEDPWELVAYFPAALDELETAAEGIVHAAA